MKISNFLAEARTDTNDPSPWELLQFQTQQVYCVRNADGSIKEGGKVNAVSFMHHHMLKTIFLILFFDRQTCALIGMSYILSFITIVFLLSI